MIIYSNHLCLDLRTIREKEKVEEINRSTVASTLSYTISRTLKNIPTYNSCLFSLKRGKVCITIV